MPQDLSMFTAEDLAMLETVDTLKKETLEVNDARAEHAKTIQNIIEGKMALTKEASDITVKTAQEQNQLLTQMEQDLNRDQEISNSLKLQLMEDFLGPFDREFSRERLRKDIATNSARLEIVDNRNALQQGIITQKGKQLDLAQEAAALQLEKERGDVIDNATLLEMQRTAKLTKEEARETLITRVNTENLPALEKLGFSKREIAHETNLRNNEDYQQRSNAYQTELQRIQMHEYAASQMAPEDWNNPKKAAEFTAWEKQQAQQQQVLQNIGFNQNITPAFLAGTGTVALTALLNQAISSGNDSVAVPGPAGSSLTLTTEDLQKAITNKLAVQSEVAVSNTLAGVTESTLKRAVDSVAMINGVTPDSGATTLTTLTVLGQQSTLPPEEHAKLEAARVSMEAAQKQQNPANATQLRIRATTLIEEVRTAERARLIEGKPPQVAQALGRYYDTGGVVQDDMDANTLLVSALSEQTNVGLFGEGTTTGRISYDRVLQNLNASIGQRIEDSRTMATAGDADEVLDDKELVRKMAQRAVLGGKDPAIPKPEEIMEAVLRDPTVYKDAAKPLVAHTLAQIYAQTARELGDETMALSIESGAGNVFATPGVLEERDIAAYILGQRTQITMPEYIKRLSSVAGRVAAEETQAVGASGAAIGALNRRLFFNRPGEYFTKEALFRMREAQGAATRELQMKAAGGGSASGIPPGMTDTQFALTRAGGIF